MKEKEGVLKKISIIMQKHILKLHSNVLNQNSE